MRQELGSGALYFNAFLVLGSYYSYLHLNSIYFVSRVDSKVRKESP